MKTITLTLIDSANLDVLETAANLGMDELFYQLRPNQVQSVTFEDDGEEE